MFDWYDTHTMVFEVEANVVYSYYSLCSQVRIRSGVVIGSTGGMIKSLKLPFYFGLGGQIADGTQPLPWIHIDDLCQLIKYAIENKSVNGPLNGVAPDVITNADFTKVKITDANAFS